MLLLLLGVAAAVDPHPSYPKLVSANGHGVVVFTAESATGPTTGVLDRFSDHLYKAPSPTDAETRDLLYDSYFGLGDSGWLTSLVDDGYQAGTGIIEVDRSQGTLDIRELAFAPMGFEGPAFVHLLRIENEGTASTTATTAWSLHNYHVGAEDGDGVGNSQESIAVGEGGIVEVGATTGLRMSILPLSTPTDWGCTEVWARVNEGTPLAGDCEADGDDRVGALAWTVPALAPGEVAWVGTLEAFGEAEAAKAWLAGRDAETLVAEQESFWEGWLGAGTPPEATLSADEQAVYDQALIFLKMAQVREAGAPYGQIPASFPASSPVGGFQHEWNITWPRGAAYAIRALTASGHHPEAQAALEYLVQPGKSGLYADYLAVDSYPVSVCRTYGDGTEWSDEDDSGPNIELDDWGLYLWAFTEEVLASGDTAFAETWATTVLDGLAEALAASVETDVGLIQADSSIWERHWNGNQQHFTYTSAWATRGLRAAATLADLLGDARGQAWRDLAETLAAGVGQELVDEAGVLAASQEQRLSGADYLDLAAVEAFNNGTLDNLGEVALASLSAWRAGLAVASGHGFRRNDDGDLYDEAEWVMVDLRLAEALRRACLEEEAAAIEEWITAQARANHDTIPELMDPESGDFAGPAPMMGFGSGLYVLMAQTRAEADADCAAGPDDGGETDSGGEIDSGGDGGTAPGDTADADDSGASPEAKDGCGCASAPGLAWWPLLAGCLALLRRRRRSAR